MTSTSRALLIVPGTLAWVLIVAGAVNGNNVMIGAGVALNVVAVAVMLTLRVRAGAAKQAADTDLWARGTAARARVISIKATGARMNRHPQIDLELAVTPAGQEPYTAHVQAYISSIAVPRIQPDCQIDVRVDPDDKQRVILDPALTP